jgi:DNA-binding transcriptional MocR family regulator
VFAEILSDKYDEERFFELAAERGVSLHPSHFYGSSYPGIFGAFSLLVDRAILRQGLDILESVL